MGAYKSHKLRQAARGRDCTLRIYPYCNNNPETVIFAHAPSSEKGMGRKSPDWWGAYTCSTCHDIIDGRMKTEINKAEIQQRLMCGIFETQKIAFDEGLLFTIDDVKNAKI